MIVVSDTSPLNYLIQLGYAELLQILYGRVLIPVAVMNELRHDGAPSVVREWVESPPSWLEVVAARTLHTGLSPELDAGEREAISLALEIRAEVLLVDEKLGRQEATALRLQVAGTLGILFECSIQGYIELPQALEQLRRLGFRSAASLEALLLARYRAAKESQR